MPFSKGKEFSSEWHLSWKYVRSCFPAIISLGHINSYKNSKNKNRTSLLSLLSFGHSLPSTVLTPLETAGQLLCSPPAIRGRPRALGKNHRSDTVVVSSYPVRRKMTSIHLFAAEVPCNHLTTRWKRYRPGLFPAVTPSPFALSACAADRHSGTTSSLVLCPTYTRTTVRSFTVSARVPDCDSIQWAIICYHHYLF